MSTKSWELQAYMWVVLAVAGGDEKAIAGRDVLAAEMTAEQIAEAQKLAREWKPSVEGGSD